MLHRIGALSAGTAVALGAVGAHKLKDREEQWREIWAVANRYHMYGSLAMIASAGIPSKGAKIFGLGVGAGTLLFSGSNYLVSFMEDRKFAKAAPVGGGILILSFFAMAAL